MTAMDLAKQRLFGVAGLAARNVQVFPGSAEGVTALQLAEQLNQGLDQLEAGEYEDVVLD